MFDSAAQELTGLGQQLHDLREEKVKLIEERRDLVINNGKVIDAGAREFQRPLHQMTTH